MIRQGGDVLRDFVVLRGGERFERIEKTAQQELNARFEREDVGSGEEQVAAGLEHTPRFCKQPRHVLQVLGDLQRHHQVEGVIFPRDFMGTIRSANLHALGPEEFRIEIAVGDGPLPWIPQCQEFHHHKLPDRGPTEIPTPGDLTFYTHKIAKRPFFCEL